MWRLWPWVGRASEPLQNEGFNKPFPERFLARGDRGSLTLANPGSWLGTSLLPNREKLLKATG